MNAKWLALIVLLVPLPNQAVAVWQNWTCQPTGQLHCRPDDGCTAQAPRIGPVEIWESRTDSFRVEYCQGDLCFQGILEQRREGWPDYRALGQLSVERLPLKRSLNIDAVFFASFDDVLDRLVFSGLGPFGQTTTWFDCERREF